MVKRILSLIFLVIISGIIFATCKRELHPSKQFPIANAGKDTTIVLPIDYAKLDGSASSDPDGSINEWRWTKISGPSNFTITDVTAALTEVKTLVAGVYQIELKVTDNDGMSAKDTMQVVVESAPKVNHAPIANAGKDSSFALNVNGYVLDGSASSDPDNNISAYTWTKISGPSSFSIANAGLAITKLTNLIEGNYSFELKVTDAGGLFSRDTVMVNVIPATSNVCDNSDRPKVNAQLIPFGTLSEARGGMAVVSAGNKILFAGAGAGQSGTPPNFGSAKVDIYDLTTQTWTSAELRERRSDIAAVAAGNKVFFAGGRLGDGAFDAMYSTVDIYDLQSNTWSVESLSEPRAYISAATVGDKVFFAGGEKDWRYHVSDVVDIYDLTTNTWSKAKLSEARSGISAVSINNMIYFAGGGNRSTGYSPSKKIDIYNNVTDSWSTSSLVEPKMLFAAIAISGQIYWAGGYDGTSASGKSCTVEIQNITTKNSTISYLSGPDLCNINSGKNAVVKDNKIIFLRTDFNPPGANTNNFDIYDLTTNTWSIGILPFKLNDASIISVNNTIYVAGGYTNGIASNKVWKLEF